MTAVLDRPVATPPAVAPTRRQTNWPLIALLAGTAVLYLWGLGASGWANSYYTAAAQAATHSWKAWFFGSFDSSSFITVDKPPASLWVMGLSARLFGVNSWAILAPQALMGVATVGLLYATVRRTSSSAAGLLAGAVLALTPVAALMFRFNNPDALLVLLLVGATYAVVRALEQASTRWLVLAAALVGTGFLTKMLQAFVVVPVFALVYLCCAPTSLGRRFRQLLAAGVTLVVASGWWIAAVMLWPGARPYIGGSQHNSVLELVLGYNGLGRLTGNETGSVGGGPAGGTGRWGATGLSRMFNSAYGGQISWLIPAALILLVTLLWLSRRAPRTSRQRAQVLLWGGWLVLTGLVFSLAKGIIHEYYSVALAPAIGALVGIGAVGLWAHRSRLVARVALALSLAVTAFWAAILLDRSSGWQPWLRPTVLVLGLGTALVLLIVHQLSKAAALAVAALAVGVALAGPSAYAIQTAATPHTGSLPTAGPAVAGARGGPGGGMGFGPPGGFAGGPGPMQGRVGGVGGLLNASSPSADVVAALKSNAGAYTWVAATIGANNAAGYQLSADEPVMAIGGFNGSDPTPTLAAFQSLVAQGKVHWFIAGGQGGPGGLGGSGQASAITSWVESTFTATTVGGVTMYDLTSATTGA